MSLSDIFDEVSARPDFSSGRGLTEVEVHAVEAEVGALLSGYRSLLQRFGWVSPLGEGDAVYLGLRRDRDRPLCLRPQEARQVRRRAVSRVSRCGSEGGEGGLSSLLRVRATSARWSHTGNATTAFFLRLLRPTNGHGLSSPQEGHHHRCCG
jgi:hypothetical protein